MAFRSTTSATRSAKTHTDQPIDRAISPNWHAISALQGLPNGVESETSKQYAFPARLAILHIRMPAFDSCTGTETAHRPDSDRWRFEEFAFNSFYDRCGAVVGPVWADDRNTQGPSPDQSVLPGQGLSRKVIKMKASGGPLQRNPPKSAVSDFREGNPEID